jgi:hypothetical protein
MTELVTIDQVWYHFRGNPIPLPLSTSWKATYNLGKYQYIICISDIKCNFFYYIRIIQIAFIIIIYNVCQLVQLMKCTSQTCF